MNQIEIFKRLAFIFYKNGYSLYLVGGSTRDYLLDKENDDFDCCTDATPSEMRTFLEDGDFRFERFGNVIYDFEGYRFEITTLRKEGNYIDYRHPSSIKYVKTLKEDFPRRDFTINAIYMDMDENVYDYTSGIEDLKNESIRIIGDPLTRIKEDPLRILRALRFSLKLHFEIEESLKKILKENSFLLEKLNPSKVNQELHKLFKIDEEKALDLLEEYHIKSHY